MTIIEKYSRYISRHTLNTHDHWVLKVRQTIIEKYSTYTSRHTLKFIKFTLSGSGIRYSNIHTLGLGDKMMIYYQEYIDAYNN